MTSLIIGTRGSKLARAQADLVAGALRAAHPHLDVEIKIITTTGDRILDVALSKIGDKGLFVKELESSLLSGEIDLAVHSAKDLTTQLPEGLTLPAFLKRGDARDALVLPAHRATGEPPEALGAWLKHGARVGTSSLRRACQLRSMRPDLNVCDVRGNVPSRLQRLLDGEFDALMLAAAGLERLHYLSPAPDGSAVRMNGAFAALMAVPLPASLVLPAVAQGTLAIETRHADARVNLLVAVMNDATTHAETLAERAFLRRLEGGCQVPIAAHARVDRDHIHLAGLVGSKDGLLLVRGEQAGHIALAEAIGIQLAETLLANGAQDILNALRAKTS